MNSNEEYIGAKENIDNAGEDIATEAQTVDDFPSEVYWVRDRQGRLVDTDGLIVAPSPEAEEEGDVAYADGEIWE